MNECLINVHVEKLPEGIYLATSEDVPGLVAQGRTFDEALEIARDVARKLLDLPEGTVRAVIKQAGLSTEEFLNL